jgi:hypothetical protein
MGPQLRLLLPLLFPFVASALRAQLHFDSCACVAFLGVASIRGHCTSAYRAAPAWLGGRLALLPTRPPRVREQGRMMPGGLQASAAPKVDVPKELADKLVLGVGVAAVDFVAAVSAFPNPDDKIRSTSLTVAGGGNAANTLVALRRLGMPTALATHLGQDGNGQQIKAELASEGVDVARCVSSAGLTSPFTYIIVDESAATRTCIHTPIARDLDPAAVPPAPLPPARARPYSFGPASQCSTAPHQ